MGQQLIKQPNGLFCFWSTVTDSINGFDFTPEDYIQQEVERLAYDKACQVYQYAMKVDAGDPAYYQFTKTWDEVAHPDPCDCGDCEGDEHDRSPKGDSARWVAAIDEGLSASGVELVEPETLEIRWAPMDVQAMGVYVEGRLMGFVAKPSYAKGWFWETLKDRYKGGIQEGVELLDALAAVLPGVDPERIKEAMPE